MITVEEVIRLKKQDNAREVLEMAYNCGYRDSARDGARITKVFYNKQRFNYFSYGFLSGTIVTAIWITAWIELT